jgi:hypothetical protein
MMPDFTIALAIGLVIGFILGYGVRAIISYRRRRRARRYRTFFEKLSLLDGTCADLLMFQSAKVSAAIAVLDRGWGKPTERHEHVNLDAVAESSDDELRNAIALLRACPGGDRELNSPGTPHVFRCGVFGFSDEPRGLAARPFPLRQFIDVRTLNFIGVFFVHPT